MAELLVDFSGLLEEYYFAKNKFYTHLHTCSYHKHNLHGDDSVKGHGIRPFSSSSLIYDRMQIWNNLGSKVGTTWYQYSLKRQIWPSFSLSFAVYISWCCIWKVQTWSKQLLLKLAADYHLNTASSSWTGECRVNELDGRLCETATPIRDHRQVDWCLFTMFSRHFIHNDNDAEEINITYIFNFLLSLFISM